MLHLWIAFQMTVIYSGDLLAYDATYLQSSFGEKCSRLCQRLCKSLSNARGYKSLSNARGYEPLSILKLDDMIKLQTALFVHRHFNKKLPTNLQSYFTNVNTCHSIATRMQACGLNYHIPKYRSSKLQHSIKCKGVKIWIRLLQK